MPEELMGDIQRDLASGVERVGLSVGEPRNHALDHNQSRVVSIQRVNENKMDILVLIAVDTSWGGSLQM